MDEDDPGYLLQQAQRCRRLGEQLGPPNDRALLDMAEEYETRAREISSGMPGPDNPMPMGPAR